MRYDTILCDTIRYDMMRYVTLRYDTIRYNTIQYNTIQCNTIRKTQYRSRTRHALDRGLFVRWRPHARRWIRPCRGFETNTEDTWRRFVILLKDSLKQHAEAGQDMRTYGILKKIVATAPRLDNGWPCPTQYNAIQYNTIQYNTLQYNTIQYNTIQYNTYIRIE